MKEAVAQLYAAMHELDTLFVRRNYSRKISNHGIGKAINDRLNAQK